MPKKIEWPYSRPCRQCEHGKFDAQSEGPNTYLCMIEANPTKEGCRRFLLKEEEGIDPDTQIVFDPEVAGLVRQQEYIRWVETIFDGMA